ncbi:MAG: glycosyltransferase family 4 protein [Krumholzibacteria bacterium]|nr:glycosyltransferase family 4 protein [Candidatus Krumholzibacteria bacterium]
MQEHDRDAAGTGAADLRRTATVVYLMDQFYDDNGGTEGQLVQLIAGLDRDRFRPRLSILYRLSDFDHAARIPCPTRCHDAGSLRRPAYWRALAAAAAELRRQRPALLHTVFPESAAAGPWLARLAGVPHVTWRRDLGYTLTPAKRRLLRLGRRWTDCWVANSEAVRESIVRREGMRPDQVVVARNTVDFAGLAGIRPFDVRTELNLPAAVVTIVLPANLRPVKGGDLAIEALALARRDGVPLHLVSIGGHTKLLDSFRRLAAGLGVADAVTFLGHRPREELLGWVRGCDIALNASRSEGYSNSNVECMLLGLPLIATAVGGNREQVDQGVTGLLVAPDDPAAMAQAMVALGRDRERRLAMGAAAALRMRHLHGANDAVARHEAIYARLLASPRGPASMDMP